MRREDIEGSDFRGQRWGADQTVYEGGNLLGGEREGEKCSLSRKKVEEG